MSAHTPVIINMMLKICILPIMIGAVFCVSTSNDSIVSLDNILDQIVSDVDTDRNGEISMAEFVTEIYRKWDVNGDGVVPCDEFVNVWTTQYHDNVEDAYMLCTNLDVYNAEGVLDFWDLLLHLQSLNINVAGAVSLKDFKQFIRQMHPGGI